MRAFFVSERFVSFLIVAMFGVVIAGAFKARAQSTPSYRVIGAMKDSTMEKELNEAARQGCEPLMGMGGNEYVEPMLVLRCP